MNPSPVFCDNCGAANEPQAKFCHVCGNHISVPTPVAPVETPVQTPLYPQGPTCPRCRKSDAVEKVSSVVGAAPAGEFAGSRFANTSQEDIRKKLALPDAPVYKNSMSSRAVLLFGIFLFWLLISVWGMFLTLQGLLQERHDFDTLGGFIVSTIFTLVLLGLEIIIVMGSISNAKEQRARVTTWQSVRARWEHTYYCARDDIIFLLGEQGTYKPASELLWFLQQTPTTLSHSR
jgi:hypothetical protein